MDFKTQSEINQLKERVEILEKMMNEILKMEVEQPKKPGRPKKNA